MDETACNYDLNATGDDGSCTYAGAGYDCNGVCFDDDGDGVCNFDEIEGCTDPTAFNYDSTATDEDGSCITEVLGCTDTAAANYNQDATEGNADADDCDFGPWGEIPTTDCNMTVLIQNGASISVEGETVTEAWIGVTNSNGVVVGSVLWTNEVTSIPVWGEEGDIPGMAAGETLNFIVSTEDGNVLGTATYSFGEGTYSCNGLSGVIAINFVSYIKIIVMNYSSL